jgi:hypothetical protein
MHRLVVSLAEALAIILKRWWRHRRIAELRMRLKVRRTPVRNVATRSVISIMETTLTYLVICRWRRTLIARHISRMRAACQRNRRC